MIMKRYRQGKEGLFQPKIKTTKAKPGEYPLPVETFFSDPWPKLKKSSRTKQKA